DDAASLSSPSRGAKRTRLAKPTLRELFEAHRKQSAPEQGEEEQDDFFDASPFKAVREQEQQAAAAASAQAQEAESESPAASPASQARGRGAASRARGKARGGAKASSSSRSLLAQLRSAAAPAAASDEEDPTHDPDDAALGSDGESAAR